MRADQIKEHAVRIFPAYGPNLHVVGHKPQKIILKKYHSEYGWKSIDYFVNFSFHGGYLKNPNYPPYSIDRCQ